MEQVGGEVWAYLKANLHRLLACGRTSAAKGNTSSPGRCCCEALSKKGPTCRSCQGLTIFCLAGKAHKVDVNEGLRDTPDPEVRVKTETVRFTGDVSHYV